MRRSIRRFLLVVRWPVGIIALAGLPAALRTVAECIRPMLSIDHWPFWSGLATIIILWFWRWRHARWGRFVTTIEHESLHAIVGMLTLIPVRELKVREDGSGHVLFEPPGHWLLYLAPYFIPLLLVIEIALVRLLHLPARPEGAVLGGLVALSFLGHLRQIHPGQTDFRHAGLVFSAAFLPAAILICYGTAFSLVQGGGPEKWLDLFSTWGTSTWEDLIWVFNQVSS